MDSGRSSGELWRGQTGSHGAHTKGPLQKLDAGGKASPER